MKPATSIDMPTTMKTSLTFIACAVPPPAIVIPIQFNK